MSDIFISYAREDREKAELLSKLFEQQKWRVWWDRVIPPGSKYADVIGTELGTAKAVIVLWSRASVASDWVKDEAQEGVNRKILVPALIDKVSPPYGFRQVQTADLSDWDGSSSHAELQRLLRSVAALLDQPITDVLPAIDGFASSKRRVWVGAALGLLILIAGFVAFYRFIKSGPGDDQNQTNNSHSVSSDKPSGALAACNADSRHKAAELTGRGLMMIDPGGNQAAAVLQFNEALSECSDYTDAYFWRGQSFVALQQNQKAIADFKKILELDADADTRQKAQKFIADLEHPVPTPLPTQTASTNFPTNSSGPNPSPSNSNQGSTHNGDVVHAQVNEMFATDKSTRIAATTRLIIEKKQDPMTVQLSVKSALAHPENKSGVINTLVYLENVDPAVLKQHRSEIEKLLNAAQANGAQTAEHIKKVQRLLGN
jgi:tetratricopeptide (TPR) repeat protein